ncbi:hypothetical protein ABEB36_000154 [Hypothenemus hampei]|uniref:Uncharacterized protein n=1 Tax=Hypothenemus hampei TaxID=57062 RepID=A0ABD1FAE5_HYPHA
MCDKLKKYSVVKLPNLDFLKNMKAFRKFVIKSITTLLKRTENIDIRLKRIEAELGNRKELIESEDEAITLPLNSVEDVEEFETELKDKQTFNKMVMIIV